MESKSNGSSAQSVNAMLKLGEGCKDTDPQSIVPADDTHSRADCLTGQSEEEDGHDDDVKSKVDELHSRAKSLAAKFQQGEGRDHIDEAIVLAREALGLCPPGHPMRSLSLSWLSYHLTDRYDQLGEVVDVDEAIDLDREAVALFPPGHPDRFSSLNSLAVDLGIRYDRLGAMDDLNQAIYLHQEALALHPPGCSDRSYSLNNLAIRLCARYSELGSMEDLDEAIRLDQEALALCPLGHPDRSSSLNSLAVRLCTRYSQLGAMGDLNQAICFNQEALTLRPPGHPLRASSLNNLANCLGTRYGELGAMADLEEAIRLNQETLTLCPPGHPSLPSSLNNLANRLGIRYNKLGAMDDLNQAIHINREALALRPPGHPDRSISLNNLALRLGARYNNLGAMNDLDEAISLHREALALCAPGQPNRSSSLNNLAAHLGIRYDKLGAMEDLDEAIRLDQEALTLRPPGHPDRSSALNNLALCLGARYDELGAVQDLSQAICLNQEALELRPPGHPERSSALHNSAVRLCARYDRLGVVDDLDQAIHFDQEVLTLCPPGHPDRSRALENLADYLSIRMRDSPRSNDEEEIFAVYTRLVDTPQMVSSADLSAARAWIARATEFHHLTTTLAYETYFRLLVYHLAALPSLPQHLDLVKDRTSSLAMDAFSTCLRSNSPTKAIELLEQGRGVFWSQLTRLRSPVDDVTGSGPEGKSLGEKFTHLTSLIRTTLHSSDADQHDHVCHLNFELQGVVDSIRRLPGLSRFLLPPLFSDLQQAAQEGPIIIVNASRYSCDALVVLADQDPVHIPLQITREGVQDLGSELYRSIARAKSDDVMRECVVVLREIWAEVVSPIVEFLQTICPSQSRIWWCPTAEFCLLPLHAAGSYRKGQQKLGDLYISSYTPTLTALVHARRRNPTNNPAPQRHFAAIGQANAKGASELPNVGVELSNIGQRLDGFTSFTRIDGPESCVSRVTSALEKNEWVHFACHGLPDPKHPFQSAFGLYDGHLTVEQIMQCELESAEFAYLSACHTTVGYEDNPDEMIHLASAMQFAGFRSVIGTMWAVNDEETTKITSTFYDNMIKESGCLDYTRAALALHKTMKKLKDIPFDQRILYVHLGA